MFEGYLKRASPENQQTDAGFFSNYKRISEFLSSEQGVAEALIARALAKGETLKSVVLKYFGNFLIENSDQYLGIQASARKLRRVTDSWNNFILEHLANFKNVDSESLQEVFCRAAALGIVISKSTVYPISLDKATISNRKVLLMDNYMYLLKLTCELMKIDNIYIDTLTHRELADLQSHRFSAAKAEILPLESVDYNPAYEQLAAIAVAAVKHTAFSQVKIYGKERLLERAFFKHSTKYASSKVFTGDNHKQVEMLKKTAIRLFCKEAGLSTIHEIDIACDT